MNILFYYYELPRQGSNLDFPDPESGVLPVTPQGNYAFLKNTKISNFCLLYKCTQIFLEFFVILKLYNSLLNYIYKE